ncbi:mucin-5B-like [Colossoma macropomum]|uniref:mucin-5B-like n=1 Tax=Colossoma macropomum TaxID=42526 RepID=UPI0018648AD8|nr:mucin-5B-like [Colossoma macropomum]
MDAPNEICEETAFHTKECRTQRTKCEQLLSDPAFSSCQTLLSTDAFVEACVKDMCQCTSRAVCVCDTLSEFSRQCAHAGGKPQNWRTHKLCDKDCPFNMQHKECGSPCKDSCSNQEESQVCAEHCVEGCFCPSGTVYNDIEENGCIPVDQCPCIHNGEIYQSGQSYNRTCQTCVCSKGQWSCKNLDCPGACSLQGGSHITTYDGKAYTFHGNCHYVLSKDNNVTVLANLVQCGQTKTETCLTEVKFIIPTATVTFLSTGTVHVNDITTNLPVFMDQVTIFKPSTFYIIAHTASLQLVIQMVPVMQVYIVASSKKKGTLSGLCGNFNDVKADDFKTESGLKEGTAATFANTWKVMTTCPDVSNCHQDPCSMSVEKERYAKEWCSLLTDPEGVFSPCHVEVNPVPYKDRCIYDACKCARSEECMCAAVSSYAHTCAAEGVLLQGWRNTTCAKFSQDCSGNMEYYYSLSSCETTCRSLSGYDYTCQVSHTPVDGCACAEGTYLDDKGDCVPASSCPCYHNNQVVAPSQVINKDGTTCTCTHGKLECLGELKIDCPAPMYYFNCSKAGPGAKGVECQKSCQTLDADQCMSTQCTSGCVCPNGLLADGQGGCVKEENCTCFHNGVFYQPGQTVKGDCNTCTCRNRKFHCTSKKCPSTCTIYGEGHYMTFDSMRYSFSGVCEYMVAQDYCGNSLSGSFRIITENILCGTTGTTCSRSVKLILGNKEFILSEEKIKVFSDNNGTEIAHKIYTVGIYIVIEASNGLVLHWDKKTSLKITLDPLFKRKVCGLCGNYDDNGKNDFVTRGGEEVVEPLEFGNSWRVSYTCPKASIISSPCNMRPHRQAWAIKQCSIIKSDVFKSCHSLVDPDQYYDICVQDTCACDTGGDCECFCTAVAVYAAACNEKGACISWRTPTICPLFCDYYNVPGSCEWHYKPCGHCVKTWSNPSGDCFNETLVEGCFPVCPEEKSCLNEITMKCDECPSTTTQLNTTTNNNVGTNNNNVGTNNNVGNNNANHNRSYPRKFNNKCHSVPNNSQHYNNGPPCLNYEIRVECCDGTCRDHYQLTTIFTTTEQHTCNNNANDNRSYPRKFNNKCHSVPNNSQHYNRGEFESIAAIRKTGKIPCETPAKIECRAKDYKDKTLADLGQNVTCDASVGLICYNMYQDGPPCLNYEIRVECCDGTCGTTTSSPPSPPTTTQDHYQLTTISTNNNTGNNNANDNRSYPRKFNNKREGGEFESIAAIRKTGKIPCETPAKIECRAKDYKDKTLADLGQNVTCDASVGLICYNMYQDGPPCLNYEIRVECCDGTCRTTTSSPPSPPTTTQVTTTPTTTGPTPESSTTSVTVSPTTASTITISSTTSATSTAPPSTTAVTSTTSTVTPSTTPEIISRTTEVASTTTTISTTATTTTTSACLPWRCQWSEWFDTSYPDNPPRREGGEFESIAAIRKTGKIPCETPAKIECRAKDYKDKTLADLGQNVTCDASVGLICYNMYQDGPPCLNYEIRVECCDGTCRTTTSSPPSPPTTTQVTTTPTTTGPTPESSTTSVTVSPTTASTITISSTTSATSTAPPSTTAVTSTTITVTPSTTPEIISRTTEVASTTISTTATTTTTPACLPWRCQWSEWFDTSYPDNPPRREGGEFESIAAIRKTGKIPCETPAKIECRAKDYKDKTLADLGQNVTCDASVGLICYNMYQDGPPCLNYEIRVECCDGTCRDTTSSPPSPPTTTQVTTTPPTTGPTPESSTTNVTVSPTTASAITISSTTSATSTAPPSTTAVTSTTITVTPSTTTEIISRTTEVASTTTTISTTATTTTTPACLPWRCQWSEWFDTSYPDNPPRREGGEFESIAAIRKTGKIPCEKPVKIECRAKDYKDKTLADLGQNVTCDASVGLICYNMYQNGLPCLNYEIRVECCDDTCGTTTSSTPPPTTTLVTTTPTTTGPTPESSTTSVTVSPTTASTTTVSSTTSGTSTAPPSTTAMTSTTITVTPSTTTEVISTTTEVASTPGTTISTTAPTSTTSVSASTQITTVNQTTTVPTTTSVTVGTFFVFTKKTTVRSPGPQKCACGYDTKTFQPGSFMYNTTGEAGQCSSVYCGQACEIVTIPQPCPSTTPTTPTTTTTTTTTNTTTITSAPVQHVDCQYVNPPRKNGETWTEDCSVKTCINGSLIILPVCKDLAPAIPVCVNPNSQAEKIKDGCCFHYECPCKCMGWGDPHYETFDGQYYAFQGNCTYVLVQEIIKKHNFSVHIKNYYCNDDQSLACPESLTIYYKSYKISLIQTRNPTVNTVLVNNEKKNTTFSNADFTITSTGIKMIVTIPAISAEINFAGMNFLVTLPSSLFHNNTEGQCGVCDNNRTNDCRLPNGQIGSCETMAGAWKVNDTHCPFIPPTISPTSTTATKTTNAPCDPDICKVILSKVFEKCHNLSSPDPFYTACKYDVCRMGNSSGCYSLEAYASTCADVSECVDWRNSTNGLCAYKCPSHKVYKACGPKVEETCNSKYNEKFVDCKSQMCQEFKEGCFCPNGTTLFSAATDVCTSFCGCVGPDGLPRKPGDKWKMNCEDCKCSAENMGPVCKPVQCPILEPCNQAGYEIKIDGCCPECVRKPVCVFNNTEYLPGDKWKMNCEDCKCSAENMGPVCKPVQCPILEPCNQAGYEIKIDGCCPECVRKPVCVFNNTEYLPGVKVPVPDICKDCSCGSTVDPETGLQAIECSPVTCNTTCSQGFSYVLHPGKCCGRCEQQQCIYTGPNKKVYTIEVGESFNPPNEKCAYSYNCTKVNDAFTLVANKSTCPAFNPENCVNGTVTTTPDGCCKTCEIQNCRVQRNNTYLLADSCTSVHPVELTSCSGSCDTSSIYSMAANSMMHRCSCCQELRISSKEVEMKCPDQRQLNHTYTYVEECGCHVTECQKMQ